MSLVAGFLVGGLVVSLVMANLPRAEDRVRIDLEHGDLPLLLDLLRRAHNAEAACLVLSDRDPVWAMTTPGPAAETLDRASAAARLAMGDGRDHAICEAETVLGAGDGRQIGGALVFDGREIDGENQQRVFEDLRKVFADVGAQVARHSGTHRSGSEAPDWLVGGPESVDGISQQLCETVVRLSGRSNALVVRDSATQVASVVSVSGGTDRRLVGARVSPTSAAGRACISDVPIVGSDSEEMLGQLSADRRRQSVGGIAYPLWDGRESVGSLAVFGDQATLDEQVSEKIQWLVNNAGPRLGRAVALRSAENRAMTDELTGLPNRRALERAMHEHDGGPCSLLCIDLDHFKALNDGFGHAAGDAALRHVAAIFRQALRSFDTPARIGGEEFALWLPGAPSAKALEVANRVRDAVRGSPLEHGGAEIRITCSIGVASIPESVSHVDNLLGAGDVAMYRAKEAGRDRIEVALPRPA